ncbi:MAG TPA: hypothetical protein VL966_19980 [Alphaproteobacteria bacterium]|nr:hypothetical protein [Alphaproteobacteria bacterium]
MQHFSKERARRFRDKAEELRAAARYMHDRQCRSMLLQIADDYENLANAAATRSHRPSTIPDDGTLIDGDDPVVGLSASMSRREAS